MSDESDIEDAGEPLFNDLIDDEAIESDDESEESEDSEPIVPFPQFMRLPPELRERVWEFFNPDLKDHRVFRLNVMSSPPELWESAQLYQQTAPARTMLSTYSESRGIALRHYPHTLDIRGGRGVLRFHGERDVVLLGASLKGYGLDAFTSIIRNVQYLALDLVDWDDRTSELLLSSATQHLKAVFKLYASQLCRKDKLAWCASDWAHRYEHQKLEDYGYGIDREYNFMYCWPDLAKHEALALENALLPITDESSARRMTCWPMIEFEYISGQKEMDRYQKICDMVAWGRDDSTGSYSGSEEEPGSTEDEYESEGIDDATVDSQDDATEDEDDLVVHSGSEEEEYEEQDVSVFNGFSPIQDEGPELHLGDEVEAGNFSSIEPESPNHDGDESSPDVSDEEPIRKTVRNKRRIVSSDNEDDAEEEGQGSPLPIRSAKRSRIVLSDTEDEDEEDGGRVAKRRDRRITVDESEDDEAVEEEVEDEDESEDEEPVKAKPMSIFEKLSQFRDDNPVSPGSDEESDPEGSMRADEFDDDERADDDDGSFVEGGYEDTFDDGFDGGY
ncbi:hypothetical protein F4821DRAFT_246668 [Hypoxylon rubiginosum]|uniref:Uncharacterized protein n=1 Tax=Hypoxylon rubiginosum TaxID=110542 RepID=A0ACC0CQN9_9PEZI|nr:hypothetical protein F4821DRAFT_246668 [Hypoxylon rubiginosum]